MTFMDFLDKHFKDIVDAGGGLLGVAILVLFMYGLYSILKET